MEAQPVHDSKVASDVVGLVEVECAAELLEVDQIRVCWPDRAISRGRANVARTAKRQPSKGVAALLGGGAGSQQHVFYQGTDNNVRHVYWDPAAGINHDQWTFDGQVNGAPATLLSS